MSDIIKYKKPELAILEEEKKIRDYEEEKAIGISRLIVKDLLDDLGVGKNANPDHHVKAIKFIVEAMKNFSFEEIRKAFTMFIAGEFREKPLQQLNSVIIGKVMNHYQNYKVEKLRVYRQHTNKEDIIKKPTIQEVESSMQSRVSEYFVEYIETKKITGIVSGVYRYLHQKEKLPKHDVEFRKRIKEKAKRIAKSEAMTQAMVTMDDRRNLNNVLSKIENGKDGSINRIAKRIILMEYFDKLIKETKKFGNENIKKN